MRRGADAIVSRSCRKRGNLVERTNSPTLSMVRFETRSFGIGIEFWVRTERDLTQKTFRIEFRRGSRSGRSKGSGLGLGGFRTGLLPFDRSVLFTRWAGKNVGWKRYQDRREGVEEENFFAFFPNTIPRPRFSALRTGNSQILTRSKWECFTSQNIAPRCLSGLMK